MTTGPYGMVRHHSKLRVGISVFGRFHAFDLACQLQRRNALGQLITTYPPFMTRRWGIDPLLVTSLSHLEALSRAWHALPSRMKGDRNLQGWFAERFDAAAARALRHGLDLLVGWSSLSLATLRRAKVLGMRTVVERGSSHIRHQTELLREEYVRWGLRFGATHPRIIERELKEYEEADRIAVPSEYVRRSFIDQGVSAQKLIKVPYGVGLDAFGPRPRRDDVFRIVHCGALSLRKGVPYLLQAFKELKLPGAELWLVGSVTPEIVPILRAHAGPGVVVKGTFAQRELADIYAQCSLFCLASLEEGLAMVIPQAMACGLPIICTTNSGGADVVRDGVDGYIVPIRDVTALKARLLQLYEDDALRIRMGRSASQRAIATLSWDRYGEAIFAAYRSVVADHLPGTGGSAVSRVGSPA